MHPLRIYLRDLSEPMRDFAKRVGVSRQTLYRIASGHQFPKPGLARRIVEATGGEVSFEALYENGDDALGVVISFEKRQEDQPLDYERLRLAIAVVVEYLAAPGLEALHDEAIDMAVEAVINTYAALSKVTTRFGPDRLRQALRPVLEEILRDIGQDPPPARVLERCALLAAEFYFRERTDQPAGKSNS